MNFWECFSEAFACMKANRMRSILTMLGVIMGVFSVITIVTVGDAAKAYMNIKFEQMGANIVQIKQKAKTVNESDWLRLADMEAVSQAFGDIKAVTAYSQNIGSIRVGSRTRDAVILGTTPSYKNFRSLEILEGGRFLIDSDLRSRNNVVLVSEGLARRYFNTLNIIGKTIEVRFNNGSIANPSVVGLMKSQESGFENMFGDDVPVFILMPVTTVQTFTGSAKLEEIMVSVSSQEQLRDTGVNAVRLLEFRHGGKDRYMAANSADMQKTVTDIMNVIQLVLLVIAIVTLIVGGIGIINILLVSVTERIREIGIRKALGAKKRDIVLQFLTEAVIMTGISGLIGIFLGILAGNIASALIQIPQILNLKVVLGSLGGSIFLGMLFGVYPAKQAADLDPIESLRYE